MMAWRRPRSERQGINTALHIPSCQQSRQFPSEQFSIRTRHVNVAVKIHAKRVDCLFPAGNLLNFIKQDIQLASCRFGSRGHRFVKCLVVFETFIAQWLNINIKNIFSATPLRSSSSLVNSNKVLFPLRRIPVITFMRGESIKSRICFMYFHM